jgi:ABC-2 type transport system permease protein
VLQVIGHVAIKEIRQLLRDRRSLILALVVPILLTFLFGKAMETGEMRQIPSVILNLDRSPDSNLIATAFSTYDEISIQGEVPSRQEAQRLLAQGKIKAAIIIPAGFTQRIDAGEDAKIELLLDGTDNNSAPIVEGVAQQIIRRYNADKAVRGLWARGLRPDRGEKLIQPVYVNTEIRYNPGLRPLGYTMPGVIGLTLTLLTVMLMAVNMTRERESGTLDQLMVTPIRRVELILGKLLPYFGLSFLNVLTILFVVDRWFHVPIRQRLTLLLVFCALFVLASLATGVLISAVSRSQFQAVQIVIFYILLVFMLSGAYAPIEAIPETIRPISNLFPLMYFCRAVRAVTLRGAGLALVWKDLVILAGFFLLMLYWAVVSFRKRVA